LGVPRGQDSNNIMEGKTMRHANSLIARAAALALMAIVGVAVMTATGGVGDPAAQAEPAGSILCTANDDAGQPAVASTLEAQPAPQPVAICKMMPECWSDSECDWKCGAGLGKCIHSKCPVRICVCR
jgi:hypothetical protein